MSFRVGYLQFQPVSGKPHENVQTILRALEYVEADLLVLPELAFTGYLFENREALYRLAEEPQQSVIVERLISLCKTRDLHIVTGFAEKLGDKVFNSALLLGPNGLLHSYRKLHLFNLEKQWFDAGDLPLSVQSVRGVKIGMMICFDWIFPEVARALALQGAQILCHPSNLVLHYCQDAMQTRCLENGVFAVTCNRVGAEKTGTVELTFTGQSQIVAPKGKMLHRAPKHEQLLFITEIDPQLANAKQITERNDMLVDRRPDFYCDLWQQKEGSA
ncbi:MAG: acyltransferase [Deferribacteres bacterium]|nr:acyltransferase [candidate division KSB1 bacterium]MCB9511000.1 acyltransferase [Deferribacteres bacterium]